MNTTNCTKNSSVAFKVGTRQSKLALIQTQNALDKLKENFPGVDFIRTPLCSPGDRDLKTDLRESPADFFTRDLDEAVLSGELDAAIHSAKDMPCPVTEGLDWFWLPWKEDPRDCIILREGETLADLPENFVVGMSSERRETYKQAHFPDAISKPIRGDIGQRIAQLDAGEFDMVLMAGAALNRLGMERRITQWISLDEMPVPEGQGTLAVTYRKGDVRFNKIRACFVKAVTFAGAGVGAADYCTLGGVKALAECDVCLYDSLMDERLLGNLSTDAKAIFVGKRAGKHYMRQVVISELIAELVRKGYRVARLKGGDPCVFGRLAEEIEILDELQMPYRVLPGVTALSVTGASTGILPTRREISRGFSVMTPREARGGIVDVDSEFRLSLPIYLYMSVSTSKKITDQLIAEGRSPEEPAAMVFGAGGDEELVVTATLETIADKVAAARENTSQPGLFIIGQVANFRFNSWGALSGRRMLLTCSEAIQEKAANQVYDKGGKPIRLPLIKLKANHDGIDTLRKMNAFDWIVITSPASVRCFMEVVEKLALDMRHIPKILTCGRGTADELVRYGIFADSTPEFDFSADALIETAAKELKKGDRVLRLRSDKAGSRVATELEAMGADVTDCIIYDNVPVEYETLPRFDDVFFASASAVNVFVEQWGIDALHEKCIVVIGKPTEAALNKVGIKADLVSAVATVEGSINAVSSYRVNRALNTLI